jgi:hypothetical protein
MLRGRWVLNSVTFVVNPDVRGELLANGFSLDFAVKYFKGVVVEFGVDITYREDLDAPVVSPLRYWSLGRGEERHLLAPEPPPPPPPSLAERVKHALGNPRAAASSVKRRAVRPFQRSNGAP